jgi:hypothetical protein
MWSEDEISHRRVASLRARGIVFIRCDECPAVIEVPEDLDIEAKGWQVQPGGPGSREAFRCPLHHL